MTKLNCIIAEDELPARELLKDYVLKNQCLNLLEVFNDGISVLNNIHKYKPDLIITDIQMPFLNGLELLCKLEDRPLIVFTTAYSQHAIDAFNLNVVDYLLKPYSLQRFNQAIVKAYDNFQFITKSKRLEESETKSSIIIRADYMIHKINPMEIDYIEGMREYVIIHLSNSKRLITHDTMKSMEKKLNEFNFIRIHKSFMVAYNKITAYNSQFVMLGSKEIPVGRSFKKSLFK